MSWKPKTSEVWDWTLLEICWKIRTSIFLRFRTGNQAYIKSSLIKSRTKCTPQQHSKQDPITRENALAWQFIMMMEFFFVFAPICTTTENYLIEIAIYLLIVASYSASNVSVRLNWWIGCWFIKTPHDAKLFSFACKNQTTVKEKLWSFKNLHNLKL